ncbi:MAG: hypothetical protein M1825_004447 [Sarcosagium campestre]|nr:MAG: hypothetical protein M1825_004447 [Sarcosagium campestre]
MTSTTPISLLIASLGNPAPHRETLHSAGHIILASLLAHHSSLSSTSPLPERWILRASPTSMNVSGPWLSRAWSSFRPPGIPPARRRLVVIHDELESSLGKVTVRPGHASARGHNGLKSAQASLPKGLAWTRIGVGIGRPAGRERAEVSDWVLRRLTPREREVLTGEQVVGDVMNALRRVEREVEGEGELHGRGGEREEKREKEEEGWTEKTVKKGRRRR